MTKKVAFTTLGCKVNQYESEALSQLFQSHHYHTVGFDEVADVYVINTCTVTHLSNRKSRQMIRRATKTNPQAVVVVTGCYAQTAPGEVLEIEGVDLVLGTKDRHKIFELLAQVEAEKKPINAVTNIMEHRDFEEELQISDHGARARAFIKIQEGCNNFCSYCIIPYARGPLRSRAPEKVLDETRKLVELGYQELVITGICTGTYGQDLNKGYTLARLLKDMLQVPNLGRIRLGSVEPTDITPELIEVLQEPKICKHIHLPLQSGSDSTLTAMGRKYNTMEYGKLVSYLRFMVMDIAITTDVIVGFPGETDEDFQRTYNFVANTEFSRLHVFKYSPRQGTKGAELKDRVSEQVKEERSATLIKLGHLLAEQFSSHYVGQIMDVVVEQEVRPGWFQGYTSNYISVTFEATAELKGKTVPVQLERLEADGATGKVIS